jgi:hypothetical protein
MGRDGRKDGRHTVSDRKTGATDDQIEAAVIRHYLEGDAAMDWFAEHGFALVRTKAVADGA